MFAGPVGAASEDLSEYATNTLARCFVTIKVLLVTGLFGRGIRRVLLGYGMQQAYGFGLRKA